MAVGEQTTDVKSQDLTHSELGKGSVVARLTQIERVLKSYQVKFDQLDHQIKKHRETEERLEDFRLGAKSPDQKLGRKLLTSILLLTWAFFLVISSYLVMLIPSVNLAKGSLIWYWQDYLHRIDDSIKIHDFFSEITRSNRQALTHAAIDESSILDISSMTHASVFQQLQIQKLNQLKQSLKQKKSLLLKIKNELTLAKTKQERAPLKSVLFRLSSESAQISYALRQLTMNQQLQPVSGFTGAAERKILPAESGSGNQAVFQWPIQNKEYSAHQTQYKQHHSGVEIQGEKNDFIIAVGDGRVIYSGEDLMGDGFLLVIAHDESVISVYGGNWLNFVQVDEFVQKGQLIAQMGQDKYSNQHRLYFEIRFNGQPEDPFFYFS